MKPVMYHYVRPTVDALPYFAYLSLLDFQRQLDSFERSCGFVDRNAFVTWVKGGPAPDGVLLTFDDGLRDHSEFVLPILRARSLFGLFYVSSGPATTGRILDVHKVHLVLGRMGADSTVAWLQSNAPEHLPTNNDIRLATSRYGHQNSNEITRYLKWLLNWHLSAAQREEILGGLFEYAFAGRPPKWQDIYLDEGALRELSDAGMGVGPHSHTHEISIRLSSDQQKKEIALSCDFVEANGGSRQWGYCYPYGSRSAFSQKTQSAVAEAGCPFAFALDARDIATPLSEVERYALPRYNCNAFPYGAVSYGSTAPPVFH